MNDATRMTPLSRGRFLLAGIVLFAIKIAIDFSVAKKFDHPYSLLYYVSPVDAPLFHPGVARNYYIAMWAVAVPFIVTGVWLTVRRLFDAALSPWLAVLFFVPFANLLFFALCALAPSRPISGKNALPDQPVYRESGQPVPVQMPERSPGATLFLSAGLGAVVGLGALALSVGVLREYGAALMCGAPTVSGFATGAFFARLDRNAKFSRAAFATLISCFITLGAIVAFAIEGVACLVMAFPLLVAPAMFGAFLGFQTARSIPRKNTTRTIVASILSLPLLMLVEHVNPLPALHPDAVTTEIIIDAPPDRVFPFVTRVSEMGPPTEALFKAGISYPEHATLDADAVGAIRRCEFNTGTALEHVTVYDAPNHFAFHIDSQPDPMREMTLYRGMRQPHLDGYVRNLEGIFDLEALPGGKTRLIAKSEYKVSITPESYWRLWTDAVVHTIHHRVLTHIKARAEGRDPNTVAMGEE